MLNDRPALASIDIDTELADGDFVVLLARAGTAGQLDIVASLGGDDRADPARDAPGPPP